MCGFRPTDIVRVSDGIGSSNTGLARKWTNLPPEILLNEARFAVIRVTNEKGAKPQVELASAGIHVGSLPAEWLVLDTMSIG